MTVQVFSQEGRGDSRALTISGATVDKVFSTIKFWLEVSETAEKQREVDICLRRR